MPKKKRRRKPRSTSPSRPRAAVSDTRSAIDSMLDDFVICRSAASPEQAVDEADHVKPLFVFLVGSHGDPAEVRWTEVLRGPRGASTLPSTSWWSERHGRFSASWAPGFRSGRRPLTSLDAGEHLRLRRFPRRPRRRRRVAGEVHGLVQRSPHARAASADLKHRAIRGVAPDSVRVRVRSAPCPQVP